MDDRRNGYDRDSKEGNQEPSIWWNNMPSTEPEPAWETDGRQAGYGDGRYDDYDGGFTAKKVIAIVAAVIAIVALPSRTWSRGRTPG